MWIVLCVVILSTLGLVLLLLPRFTPRTPRWAEAFVPPRYRRRGAAATAPDASTPAGSGSADDPEESPDHRTPVAAGVSGVNGATAVGPRARLADRSRSR
jgi:UDP-GlcNAc:undecaprenyl-phosphate GlcNAc-1-phosphate transferase